MSHFKFESTIYEVVGENDFVDSKGTVFIKGKKNNGEEKLIKKSSIIKPTQEQINAFVREKELRQPASRQQELRQPASRQQELRQQELWQQELRQQEISTVSASRAVPHTVSTITVSVSGYNDEQMQKINTAKRALGLPLDGYITNEQELRLVRYMEAQRSSTVSASRDRPQFDNNSVSEIRSNPYALLKRRTGR